MPEPNLNPPSMIEYYGSEYGCSGTNMGICYWTDLELAQRYCQLWTICKTIYETDQIPPATTGNPVYWAMSDTGSASGFKGGLLWRRKCLLGL